MDEDLDFIAVIVGFLLLCTAFFIGLHMGENNHKALTLRYNDVCEVQGGTPYQDKFEKPVCLKNGQIIPVNIPAGN